MVTVCTQRNRRNSCDLGASGAKIGVNVHSRISHNYHKLQSTTKMPDTKQIFTPVPPTPSLLPEKKELNHFQACRDG